ncbi:replication factor C subunit 1 [Raphanus sativus]|uniref:Replication factor C subunit 1 n=1 Tax=Raphanus sativus TaxID=3726 RepID=A0A9W3CKB8_RAPSA|nr:replication factor C subunit 1 [Raphanus sativus]XP_056852010.1 replication factor C subunit 1 [Raphanus sativus]
MSNIRKWFVKPHDDKGNGNAAEETAPLKSEQASEDLETAARRKTSKYFAKEKAKAKEVGALPAKRKLKTDSDDLGKPRPGEDIKVDGDDFEVPSSRKTPGSIPSKKLKCGSGRGIASKTVVNDEDGDDGEDAQEKDTLRSGGRGRGGRAASGGSTGGRGGRGGGRGGFMNFGERKDPPHKGQKEVPEGSPDCLAGLTLVISGTLDSLEREEAEDLIKRHGGRVTGAVSKKTTYLLCDEDIGGRKSEKAKELGTKFLTEDGLFDMIRSSKPVQKSMPERTNKGTEKVSAQPKKSPQKEETRGKPLAKISPNKVPPRPSPAKGLKKIVQSSLPWTEKYRPKLPNEIVGNQSMVTELHNWLSHWHDQSRDTGSNFFFSISKGKGKKYNDAGVKKAVLLSGTPGIGKTTSAKLVSQMLGFQAVEVNASDSRGKANSNIAKGIGGSIANTVKELVNNEALASNIDRSKHPKTVLIMDEVDGMSAGDRGGVADLIASIKMSKIPIICICNDRYSQKLKSLANYCLPLNFRKPTKQQMAKRLTHIAKAEGLEVNDIALEELAERVNGDIRLALNQLQYMSLSMSVIKYDDIRQRLLSSAKDEDISPFTAVDKLFGYNGGKLRMDERIDLSMSDFDLVPLLIQENYLNYRPSSAGKDEAKRMELLARAAESVADGDIINVQIRRHRQWQLSPSCCVASSILPASLLHGSREVLEQGESTFNRFGGWLGKNSTAGKNTRLLEELHVHVLASRESSSGRETLRVDYLPLLLNRLTSPLKTLPKDEAVSEVVAFMNTYSISQEDYDTIMELAKFKGRTNPLEGVPPAVKTALTRKYKETNKTRMVRAADMVQLPGVKKAPKKRIAAMLEPTVESLRGEDGEQVAENEEDKESDAEDSEEATNGEKLESNLKNLNARGIRVEVDLKVSGSKKTTGRGRGKDYIIELQGSELKWI